MPQTNPIDQAVQGDVAAATYGVTGVGIKVGIIADSFNNLGGEAADIAAGALPVNTDILSDGTGGADEGRAMAQIVHDVAPGAAIDFYSGVSNIPGRLAQAINALVAAGCNVIVDDLSYPQEAPNGVIDQAVNAAVAHGVTYVTSAGNARSSDPLTPSTPIYGHAADLLALTVAAMNYQATPNPPSRVGGIITPPQTENFSSLGVPGSGKPNLTGPDGGPTTFPPGSGLDQFFGTSAAAPAVAAVAALMMQENPQLKTEPLTVDQLLQNTALPFGEPANYMGAGLVQALEAVAAAAAAADFVVDNPPQALPAVKTVMFAPGRGNVDTGGDIAIIITMTTPITIAGGPPTLQLNDGGTAVFDAADSDPATGQLTFTYQVAAGQTTPSLAVTAVQLNGATIQDSSADNADLSALVGAASGITVNSPLQVSSVTAATGGHALVPGTTIQLTVVMTEPVSVNAAGGAPKLLLNDGEVATYEANQSNPGAGRLTFNYTIGAGDTIANLRTIAVDLLPGTTVRDNAGNNADFSGAVGAATGLKIGTSPLSAPNAPVLYNPAIDGPPNNLAPAFGQPAVGGLQITNESEPRFIVNGPNGTIQTLFNGNTPIGSSDGATYNFGAVSDWNINGRLAGPGSYQVSAVASDESNDVIPSAASSAQTIQVVPKSQTAFIVNSDVNLVLAGGSYFIGLGDRSPSDTGLNAVSAGNGNDVITGGSGTDWVGLGNGNDYINLGAGAHYIATGDGNDVISLAGSQGDRLTLGNGNHFIVQSGGSATITAGNGSDVLLLTGSGQSSDQVSLENGNKVVIAGSGGNSIELGNGNDTIILGGGANFVGVGNGNDYVQGGSGSDSILLGAGSDVAMAGSGSESFVLGSGNYQLFLGTGTDQVEFSSHSAHTAIFGFNPQLDQLQFLSQSFDFGIDNAKASSTLQPIDAALFSPNPDGSFASGDNRFAYNDTTGQLYYDASGSSAGSSALLVATLFGAPHLTAANIYYGS